MTALARAAVRRLGLSAAEYSLTPVIDVTRQRSWASALFVGTRLTVDITCDDDSRLDEWLIALPDMDMPLAGHFVASAELVEHSANAATIELLIVES